MSSTTKKDGLRLFLREFSALVDRMPDEARFLREGAAILYSLISSDDWLADEFAEPNPQRYRQYLLYCDPRERFSVVSFVWGPGQSTPIHNHTTWGLIGMLRGAENAQRYRRDAGGALIAVGVEQTLRPGDIDIVSPSIGDIHRVANAYQDRVSISIHVYGANIGGVQREIFDASGLSKPFVSGYANSVLPNVWIDGLVCR